MSWSTERCYQNQDVLFAAMIETFRSAQQSIDFETFIFERDVLGNQILDELIVASKRGVKVRILVDGIGSPQFDESAVRDLESNGVRVRIYSPVRTFLRSVRKLVFTLHWRGVFGEIAQMNRRNHRKTCVIDRRAAWIGSANVSTRHREWRETAVYVEGDDIRLVAESFDWLWARSRSGWRHHSRLQFPASNAYVHTSYGFHAKWKSDRYLREMIDSARVRIRLVNPYFIPPLPLLLALLRAGRNRVAVEIMVPFSTDWKFVTWVAKTYYAILLGVGVRIFEYRANMLHSKILIVDDHALVGSSNFNFRSFFHDLEIDVLLEKPDSIESLDRQWEKDIQACTEVYYAPTQPLGWFGNKVEEIRLRIFAFFKRIM